MEFKYRKYNVDLTEVIHKVSVNSKGCICKTYHSSLKIFRIPVQAVCNKLKFTLNLRS